VKVFLAGRVGIEAGGVVLDERHFPGRQGRLLFAYLALEHGGPVPREKLAETLWGDDPPATWDKALSVLVSKLRVALAQTGVDGASALTAPYGCYRLDLPHGSTIDVLEAQSAASEAETLLESNELEEANTAATLAESLLRRPFLPGDDGSWVEAKRRELADVRARVLSTLAETSLRSGKAHESERWAEQLIEVEPFRESGYRHLMLAHIAAGNRAEALQVYERCRRLLAEELGAYPSPETESIYRGLLEAPSGGVQSRNTSPAGSVSPRTTGRKRRAWVAAAVAILVAATAVIAVVAKGSDGTGAPSASKTARVALVVPRSPPGSDDPSAQYQAALARAGTTYGIDTQTFAIDLSKPGLSQRVRGSIGDFGLVLLAGQFVDARFAHEIARHPGTRFVVMDPDPENEPASLYSAVSTLQNATDVFFIEGPGAYLAGYLGALMAKRRASAKRPIVVSVIAGDSRVNEHQVAGFTSGARDAVPGARVLEDYSDDYVHPAVCAAIANRQIDHGSSAVFADAGACSVGALSAAGTRGVWGVGADEDRSYLGSQVLVSTVKRLDRAVDYSIRSYVDGTLPQGHLDIGIERGAVDIVGVNRVVPASIRAKVEEVKRRHMTLWTSWATPLR
jgi:DNA-binding SARP family transcriptional activator/basic membrane lipoprotein Med (substrate-binding protein (PBP1-ABC) superfamily)